MKHDEQIIRLLTEAGSAGLSKDKIARHIFNSVNTFFQTADFDTVKREVNAFVRANSKDSYSLLEKLPTSPRRYRINRHSSLFTQLPLNFIDKEPDAPDSAPGNAPDEQESLSLAFDF